MDDLAASFAAVMNLDTVISLTHNQSTGPVRCYMAKSREGTTVFDAPPEILQGVCDHLTELGFSAMVTFGRISVMLLDSNREKFTRPYHIIFKNGKISAGRRTDVNSASLTGFDQVIKVHWAISLDLADPNCIDVMVEWLRKQENGD